MQSVEGDIHLARLQTVVSNGEFDSGAIWLHTLFIQIFPRDFISTRQRSARNVNYAYHGGYDSIGQGPGLNPWQWM